MQIFTKPPFGHVARSHRQTRKEGSAEVVMKQSAQVARASAEPNADIFLDELMSPIISVELKKIPRLAGFLPVIVLIPRSTPPDQVAPHKTSVAKSSNERSETTNLPGALGKAVERFKSTSGGSTVAFAEILDSEHAARDFTRRTAQRSLGIRELSLHTNGRQPYSDLAKKTRTRSFPPRARSDNIWRRLQVLAVVPLCG